MNPLTPRWCDHRHAGACAAIMHHIGRCSGVVVALALSMDTARAEPLWGGPDYLHAREFAILPGAWIFPVNGYGGSVTPEIYAGMGLGRGFDLRGGIGVDTPLYHRDDGAVYWGYLGPDLDFFDLAARYRLGTSLGLGLRIGRDRHEDWGVGPELTWAGGGARLSWTVRPAWRVPLSDLENVNFGVISAEFVLRFTASPAIGMFVDATPWVGLSRYYLDNGGSDWHFGVEPGLQMNAGVDLRLDAIGRHRLFIAIGAVAEDADEAEGYSIGLRYRATFGMRRKHSVE